MRVTVNGPAYPLSLRVVRMLLGMVAYLPVGKGFRKADPAGAASHETTGR